VAQLTGTVEVEQPIWLVVDQPSRDADIMSPYVTIAGWSAGPHRIARVEVTCDGSPLGAARIGLPRPDVATVHPELVEVGTSGFEFVWNASRLPSGIHEIAIQAFDIRNRVAELTRRVVFQNDPLLTLAGDRLSGDSAGSPVITSSQQVLHVIYVSGWPGSPSHVYRVDHQVEALQRCGVAVECFSVEEAIARQSAIVLADILVLFRVAWTDEVATVVERARMAGTRIVYDIDDYVFDSAVANERNVDGIRFLPKEAVDLYHDGVRRYRAALLNADESIFSTKYLADKASETSGSSHWLPNGFDHRMLGAANAAKVARKTDQRAPERVRLGYASGTLTHQKDFGVAVPALARILRERSEVTLTAVGQLDLQEFPQLRPYQDRIERRPFVAFAQVPREIARFDVNLAPLEIGNPYCEAKSELKYYEAALVGVPTVASGTQTFRDAIRHGETGFIAMTVDDWYTHLSVLVGDRQLRDSIAAAARTHALAVYGPEAKKEAASRLFWDMAHRARELVAKRRRTITFMLPAMDRGSGGHRNVIMLAKGLASRGYRPILTLTGPTASYPTPESLMDDFRLYEQGVRVTFASEPQEPSDFTVATFWKTVYIVRDSSLDLGIKIHFVQDYEALFYPMGTDHVGALNALNQHFLLVTWGPWATDLLAARHGAEAAVIPIPIDHDTYRVRDGIVRRKDLVAFFARPEMPRRCFELGVKALECFRDKYTLDVEIVLFGSNRVPPDLPFQFEDMGILRPDKLAELYSRATVGLAFSPTNPSSVPYEMMASGLPVIDIDIPGNDRNYGDAHNVMLARPEANDIADAIFQMLSDADRRDSIAGHGTAFAGTLPSEHDTVEAFARILEKAIADQSRRLAPTSNEDVARTMARNDNSHDAKLDLFSSASSQSPTSA
jgi:glycosyltransferase involved in cell wall biosynthesis